MVGETMWRLLEVGRETVEWEGESRGGDGEDGRRYGFGEFDRELLRGEGVDPVQGVKVGPSVVTILDKGSLLMLSAIGLDPGRSKAPQTSVFSFSFPLRVLERDLELLVLPNDSSPDNDLLIPTSSPPRAFKVFS